MKQLLNNFPFWPNLGLAIIFTCCCIVITILAIHHYPILFSLILSLLLGFKVFTALNYKK